MAVATFAQGNALQHARPAHLSLPVANFLATSSGSESPLYNVSKDTSIEQIQSRVLAEFGNLRSRALSVLNSAGPRTKLLAAASGFVSDCHKLMLYAIIHTGNLDAARKILHSGEKLLEQVDKMYFSLGGEDGKRLEPFPDSLRGPWMQVHTGKSE